MSQEQLAQILGLTFQQVQKYERGVNRIAASRLHDIAVALEAPVAAFYEGLSRKKVRAGASNDLIASVLATSAGVELIRLFGDIKSPRVRRRVVNLVRAMARAGE